MRRAFRTSFSALQRRNTLRRRFLGTGISCDSMVAISRSRLFNSPAIFRCQRSSRAGSNHATQHDAFRSAHHALRFCVSETSVEGDSEVSARGRKLAQHRRRSASRPVVRAGAEWRVESHQTTYHKRSASRTRFQSTPLESYKASKPATISRAASRRTKIYELYVRLSSSNNEPDEAGSDGPHEGVVQPLVLGMNRDGRPLPRR